MRQRLYVLHGSGPDAVGLVGEISFAIADIGGNIVDLRQDVMHGLFTIYLVVDLGGADTDMDGLRGLVTRLNDDTGLDIQVERYKPSPVVSRPSNMLLILLGNDRPGIISMVTETLRGYRINIQSSQMVAREHVFLMDLMTDVSKSAIPMDNLRQVLSEKMSSIGIHTMFQSEDVFNKKKRVILFDITSSFIDPKTLDEIIRLCNIDPMEISDTYSSSNVHASVQKAASLLYDLPVEVMTNIIDSFTASAETLELVEALKTMGYRIGLISTGFNVFTNHLIDKLGIDFCSGFDLGCDDDSRVICEAEDPDWLKRNNREMFIDTLVRDESIDRQDITIISDLGLDVIPGLRLDMDMNVILDYVNEHILSREALIGVLGCFGIPVIRQADQDRDI
ncbi:MAG: ACT domain-containing protein [Thermodesulfobacteriota bacterium]|nr:ACT domain-containing protein [Thermodesulfobacteriota bacterium]